MGPLKEIQVAERLGVDINEPGVLESVEAELGAEGKGVAAPPYSE